MFVQFFHQNHFVYLMAEVYDGSNFTKQWLRNDHVQQTAAVKLHRHFILKITTKRFGGLARRYPYKHRFGRWNHWTKLVVLCILKGSGFYLVPKKHPTNFQHGWRSKNMGKPPNEWFIMENPIKMDDLGVPLFLETPISRVMMGNDFNRVLNRYFHHPFWGVYHPYIWFNTHMSLFMGFGKQPLFPMVSFKQKTGPRFRGPLSWCLLPDGFAHFIMVDFRFETASLQSLGCQLIQLLVSMCCGYVPCAYKARAKSGNYLQLRLLPCLTCFLNCMVTRNNLRV